MTNKYLLSDVDLGEEEALAAAEVVRSKWLSVGPRTAEFENQFAEFMGSHHAVAVSSCTAALHLALMALDVRAGDEVLVPSFTFVASAKAILYQGAIPVFVDITGEQDLNMDVVDLEAKISPQTKAIIVVHLAGFPAQMNKIMEIANHYNLAVIEDACHAIGANYQDGQRAGTLGDIGCFSFFANKNLVTGEGGMLVTDRADLAKKVRLGRSHGMTKTSWDKASGRASSYDVTQLGYNYRSTEITAAIVMIQLRKLEQMNQRRRELAAYYRKQLFDYPGIILPFPNRLADSAHHIFPIILENASGRDSFRQELDKRGIQTSVHYPPVHLFSHYLGRFPGHESLPKTEDISSREVTLPLHPLLMEEDVDYICDSVKEVASEYSNRLFV